MFRKLNSLTPPFLKSIDKYLLLNRPGLWATRIHYVLFFVLVFGGLLMLNAIVRPIDLGNVPSPEMSFILLILPCILAFGIWAYQVSLFQVEKGLGQKKLGNLLLDQLVYAVVILMLAAIPYLYGSILTTNIDRNISDEELMADVNDINMGIVATDTGKYFFNRSIENQSNLSRDSLEEKIKNWNHDAKKEAIIRSEQLMHKYSISKLPVKRTGENEVLVFEYYSEVEWNLNDLVRIKNGRLFFQEREFQMFYLFFLLVIWLVLQCFFYIGWKQLILSIIFGFICFGGIGLITTTIEYSFDLETFDNDDFILDFSCWVLLNFFVFFIFLAYWNSNSTRYHTWKSINLTLAVFMTPILVFLVSILDNRLPHLDGITLSIFTIGISIFAWNLFYQPRFAQLQAIPKHN